MNNHLQLCRILLLQILGKLKPISILSPLQRNLSRSCSCSPALLAVPWVAGVCCRLQAMPALGLGTWAFLLSRWKKGWMLCYPALGSRDVAEVGAEPGLISLEQHQRVREGQGMQGGGLNLCEKGGYRLCVALGHQEHKFVPFASAKAIKHTERAIPECLPAFRWVYTDADVQPKWEDFYCH